MTEIQPELRHITNKRTQGMPHEASDYTCWCVDSVPVLQEEVRRLRKAYLELLELVAKYGEEVARIGKELNDY